MFVQVISLVHYHGSLSGVVEFRLALWTLPLGQDILIETASEGQMALGTAKHYLVILLVGILLHDNLPIYNSKDCSVCRSP